MYSHHKIYFTTFLFCSLLYLNSCISPRCVVPNCQILVDHAHPIYGAEVAVGRSNKVKGKKGEQYTLLEGVDQQGGDLSYSGSTAQLYRGLPWYVFLFRKRHKPDNPMLRGRYRHIDEREIQKHRNRNYAKRNVRNAGKLNQNLLTQRAKTEAKREKRNENIQEELNKFDEKLSKLDEAKSKVKVAKDITKAREEYSDLTSRVSILDSSGTKDAFLTKLEGQEIQLIHLEDDLNNELSGGDDVVIIGEGGESLDKDKKRRDRKKKDKKKKGETEDDIPIPIGGNKP